MPRFADWCGRQLMPIFRRRALRRLAGDIDAYVAVLRGRAASDEEFKKHLPSTIEGALTCAREAIKNGKIDDSWKQFQAAHRLELFALKECELKAIADSMRKEANKLNVWRRNAVLDLLNPNLLNAAEKDKSALAIKIFRAATLRDEHYNNEAYRHGLRRSNTFFLAAMLLVALALLLFLAHKEYLLDVGVGASIFSDLLSMAVVGLLGAAVSAITNAPRSQDMTPIPEVAWSIHVALLRLLMGPASAMLIYFVTQSALYDQFLKVKPEGYALLALAFVAGFTERLVLRVVEAIAKAAS